MIISNSDPYLEPCEMLHIKNEMQVFYYISAHSDFPSWLSPFPNFGLCFLFQSEMLACLLVFYFFFKSGCPTVKLLKFYFLQQVEHVFRNTFIILFQFILPKLRSLYDRGGMLAANRGERIQSFQTQAFYNCLTHGRDCWSCLSKSPQILFGFSFKFGCCKLCLELHY